MTQQKEKNTANKKSKVQNRRCEIYMGAKSLFRVGAHQCVPCITLLPPLKICSGCKRNLPTGVPHDRDSVLGPTHPVPHSLPAIHERLLVIVPDPHRVEQALHCPNAVHRELTGIEK